MAVSESKPNQRDAVEARRRFLFEFARHWPGAPDTDRSTTYENAKGIVLVR